MSFATAASASRDISSAAAMNAKSTTQRAHAASAGPEPSDPPLTVRATVRPTGGQLPPLITYEEALALGEIEDHAEIEALVDRAFAARLDRFGDSTDMCSLVNAKSGGCAEDCGFCAQSRFAEADTPMHAMMTPDQILEHAKAAEAAGAHRFCMVTQGQGLSKRDFENVVEGAKLVAEHTNLKRCVSIGHCRATGRTRSGRPASSACTTTWRPRRATTARSRPRFATRAASARSTPYATPGSRPAW